MNAKQSKKLVQLYTENMPSSPMDADLGMIEALCMAKGYLEALEGEEVKTLIKTLEDIKSDLEGTPFTDGLKEFIDETLSKYREAIAMKDVKK